MSEKTRLKLDIEDDSLRWAVTKFIQNMNTLMEPVVKAIQTNTAWRDLWRESKSMPDGFQFPGDREPRKAWLQAAAIYNDEQQVGKIIVEIVEGYEGMYKPSLPLRRQVVLTDVVLGDMELVITQAIEDFDEQVAVYCKRKNGEVQS